MALVVTGLSREAARFQARSAYTGVGFTTDESRANGTYVGAPKGATKILPNDNLVLYGRSSALEELDRRLKGRVGDRAHDAACFEQKQVLEEEREDDPAEHARA